MDSVNDDIAAAADDGTGDERPGPPYAIDCNCCKSMSRALAIQVASDVIGFISLEQITWARRQAELKIHIESECLRGRGFGTDAVWTILRYALDELRLDEVYLRVTPDNARAIACYRKCGFRPVGRLKAGRHREHGARDLLLMSVTRSRWLNLSAG